MSWLDGLRERARWWTRRAEAERELEEELRFHLENETERAAAAGGSREQARRLAAIRFGGVSQARERVRAESGRSWADDLLREALVALRGLRRRPGFAAAVLVTLALGLGAATATFSVVRRVLLRPLPFATSQQLVVVWETDRDSDTRHEPASVPDFLDLQERSRTLAGLAAVQGVQVNAAAGAGDPERLDALAVSHGLPRLLGVAPRLGRGFRAADDRPGGAPVAMLGEEYWRLRFAADPGVLGRAIELDGTRCQIVGVMPEAADYGLRRVLAAADYGDPFTDARRQGVDVWLPLRPDPRTTPRETHPIVLLGRRTAGASVAADLETTYPENRSRGTHLEPLREVVVGPLRRPLAALLAGVGLVLLIACVNVAHLLLARNAARRSETAVRRALGAGDGQLLRQFTVEAGWLTSAAVAGGLGVAVAALAVLRRLVPGDVPGLREVAPDPVAAAAAVGVTAAITLVLALVPWLHARRRPLSPALRGRTLPGSPAAAGRGRQGLVIAELALAVVLVFAAGLLVRGFWDLVRIDPGFRTAGVVKAQFQLPASRYPADYSVWPAWRENHAFRHALVDRLRALPGVEAATVAAVHPLDRGFTNSFAVVGREAEAVSWPEISVRQVSPGYFATLGVPVVDGRGFRDTDNAESPLVGVLNRAALRRFFPQGRAIGQQIGMWGRLWQVVGVVGDERFHGLSESAPPALYVALDQAPSRDGVALVRTAGDPQALVGPVADAVRAGDPALAVYGAEPLAATVARSVAEPRFVMVLLTAFAGIALLLAAVGVHGLLAYRVALRIPELGLRMALGASRGRVVRRVVGEGLLLAAAGLVLGGVGALAAARLLAGLVYGGGAADPWTLAEVGAVVLAAAVLASLPPARRATGADPLAALRVE